MVSLESLINFPVLYATLGTTVASMFALLWSERRSRETWLRLVFPLLAVGFLSLTHVFRMHEEHFEFGFLGVIITRYVVWAVLGIQLMDLTRQIFSRFRGHTPFRLRTALFNAAVLGGVAFAFQVSTAEVLALGPLSIELRLPPGYSKEYVELRADEAALNENADGRMIIKVPKDGLVAVRDVKRLQPAFSVMAVLAVFADGDRQVVERYEVLPNAIRVELQGSGGRRLSTP